LVSSASSGEAGIAAFDAANAEGRIFDAVITDLGMPGVDGRRVAAAVKQNSHATPVILLTGWGERMKAEDDVPSGVDCVLSKPPKLKEVRAALAQCCAEAALSKAG
jgi:CheY-like chemotaxis protein